MIIYIGPEELITTLTEGNEHLYNQYTGILSINNCKTALKIDNTKKFIEIEEKKDLDYYKEILDFEELKELVSRYYLIDYANLQYNLHNLNMLISLAYDANLLPNLI